LYRRRWSIPQRSPMASNRFFLFYSIPIPRFQAGRRMRLSTNSWRRVCKHMSRAKQNRKDYRSQLHMRPKTRATDGSREEPIERLRISKLWGLKENFSLQFHQLLAKSHPMRMSSSLGNIINICKRFPRPIFVIHNRIRSCSWRSNCHWQTSIPLKGFKFSTRNQHIQIDNHTCTSALSWPINRLLKIVKHL